MHTSKRPLSITIIGWIYIIMGVAGFVYHLARQWTLHPFPYDILWVELIFLAAILSGAFMLRGQNWARWLALAWIAFHVVLSVFHNLPELTIHSLLCAILAYFLFRAAANRYFRPAVPKAT
ncbi:MAG: hypothetical protein EPN47_02315 [Acidobacteria bacterium]|nr:MAG: hypothetical protein EPN47_02315 [Acidobacteriota bacterium]